MIDGNNKILKKRGGDINFLIDTSAFQIFEEWHANFGINILKKIRHSGF